MQAKETSNWMGLTSIVWMMTGFFIIHDVMVPRHIMFGPLWLFLLVTLGVQMVPGLLFALAGMRCKAWAGRICVYCALGLFLWFVWYGVLPAMSVMRM